MITITINKTSKLIRFIKLTCLRIVNYNCLKKIRNLSVHTKCQKYSIKNTVTLPNIFGNITVFLTTVSHFIPLI